MTKLRLTFACGPYDRTQSLRDGTLAPEGIDLVYLPLQPAEIFWRMLQYREFDASEMSLSNYTTLVSQGDPPFIAIPAFPSRVFRHGYFFINTDNGIRHPGDLKGKRGGVPGIQHDRRGLHARPAGARIRRQAERRRMGAGPPRPSRPRAAAEHPPDPGAARRPSSATCSNAARSIS